MYRTHDDRTIREMLKHKLDKFNIYHHETTRKSFHEHIRRWDHEIQSNRCPICWLRPYDCYCKYLLSRREYYQSLLQYSSSSSLATVKIVMYYHYQEIGRSANTAHLLEALCPNQVVSLVFGDSSKEISLFETIREKTHENFCILYPTSTSISLSEWMDSLPPEKKSNPTHLIVLDGTYSQALRQFKHIKKCSSLYDVALPAVKLDLGPGGCRSAITGVMVQPQKDKICTYQAVVMALRQAGMDESTYSELRYELDLWMEHILKKRIRLGKTSMKPLGLDDSEEESYLSYIAAKEEIDETLSANSLVGLKDIVELSTSDPDIATIESYLEHGEYLERTQIERLSHSLTLRSTKKFGVFDIQHGIQIKN